MGMLLTARTTLRASVLMQVADYIFSTTMDAYRYAAVCPFLAHLQHHTLRPGTFRIVVT